jgi:hypothetical protein
MIPFAIAKAAHDALDSELSQLSATLRDIERRLALEFNCQIKGPMGLTSEPIRLNPEYRQACRAYDIAFARLRAFNGAYVKTYAKELRDERRKRGR